jgi:hypothetical protein
MIKLSDHLDRPTRAKLKMICEMFNAQEFEIFERGKSVLFVKLHKKEEKPCGS